MFFLSDENTFTFFLRVFKPFALFTRLKIKQTEEREFTHMYMWKEGNFGKYLLRKIK